MPTWLSLFQLTWHIRGIRSKPEPWTTLLWTKSAEGQKKRKSSQQHWLMNRKKPACGRIQTTFYHHTPHSRIGSVYLSWLTPWLSYLVSRTSELECGSWGSGIGATCFDHPPPPSLKSLRLGCIFGLVSAIRSLSNFVAWSGVAWKWTGGLVCLVYTTLSTSSFSWAIHICYVSVALAFFPGNYRN